MRVAKPEDAPTIAARRACARSSRPAVSWLGNLAAATVLGAFVVAASDASGQALRARQDIAQDDGGHAIWIQGDAERGRVAFSQCRSCHAVGPGAQHRTGPHFNGLVGRRAGSAEGYPYSLVLVKLGLDGFAWTQLGLEHFLWSPDVVTKRSPFQHVGIQDPQTRADLIAYLSDPETAERRRFQGSRAIDGNAARDRVRPTAPAAEGTGPGRDGPPDNSTRP
ncbi:MAG: hypothetical protein AAFW46_12345 [Pseudomonadota bacterium]